MANNNLNIRQAIDFIEKTEQERLNFRKRFADGNDKTDEYDLIINLSRMTMDETIKIILSAAQIKGLLEHHRSKVEVF